MSILGLLLLLLSFRLAWEANRNRRLLRPRHDGSSRRKRKRHVDTHTHIQQMNGSDEGSGGIRRKNASVGQISNVDYVQSPRIILLEGSTVQDDSKISILNVYIFWETMVNDVLLCPPPRSVRSSPPVICCLLPLLLLLLPALALFSRIMSLFICRAPAPPPPPPRTEGRLRQKKPSKMWECVCCVFGFLEENGTGYIRR